LIEDAQVLGDSMEMERKISWNLYVYESLATEFDSLIKSDHRGEKGTTVSAACLMFLLASRAERQAMVDLIKLAEGRGVDGTLAEAARKAARERALADEAADEANTVLRDNAPNAKSAPGRGGRSPRRKIGG
jgi:hypothetical protein